MPHVSSSDAELLPKRLPLDNIGQVPATPKHLKRHRDMIDQPPSMGNRPIKISKNPFEKLSKRSGKYLDDTDDSDDTVLQELQHDDGKRDIDQHQQTHQTNLGSWTAGVMGMSGGSSKLQALQKWFKSESIDGREAPTPKRKTDLSELASVSVRDLVKAIGGGGGNADARYYVTSSSSSQQRSQSSSPISIPFSKFLILLSFKCVHF